MHSALVSYFFASMKTFSLQFSLPLLRTLLATLVVFVPSFAFAGAFSSEEVADRANRDREAMGLPALRIDSSLTEAALLKATDMSEKEYFAHTAPDGTKPWAFFDRAGYRYRYAGENLAIHFSDVNAQEAAWMKSEKHRENILSPKYADIGVAVADLVWEGKTTTVTVQLFGTRIGEVVSEATLWKNLSDDASLVSGETIALSESVGKENGILVRQSESIPLMSHSFSADSILYFLFLLTLAGIGLLEGIACAIVYHISSHRHRIFHLRIVSFP